MRDGEIKQGGMRKYYEKWFGDVGLRFYIFSHSPASLPSCHLRSVMFCQRELIYVMWFERWHYIGSKHVESLWRNCQFSLVLALCKNLVWSLGFPSIFSFDLSYHADTVIYWYIEFELIDPNVWTHKPGENTCLFVVVLYYLVQCIRISILIKFE